MSDQYNCQNGAGWPWGSCCPYPRQYPAWCWVPCLICFPSGSDDGQPGSNGPFWAWVYCPSPPWQQAGWQYPCPLAACAGFSDPA